jgi:transcriptional regulator with XRE-family HTH domain
MMETLYELGEAIAKRRHDLGVKQGHVAELAGITQESLSRLERGRSTEFGARKLLAVLSVLGMEIRFSEKSETPVASVKEIA